MTVLTPPLHVEIDAPDGAAALALEHRLLHLNPTTVGRGRRWLVELDGVEALDEVDALVGWWLREIGEPSTVVHVDDRELRIEAHPVPGSTRGRQHRASNRSFVG